jgi:hypothetical protein
MFWVDSDKPRCRKQSGGRPRPNRKPDARQGNNACGHPSWLRRPTIVGRIAYQAEFTVAFEGTADMGLTSAHRNPPFMTHKRHARFWISAPQNERFPHFPSRNFLL